MKFGSSIGIFLNSANLIFRSTDISKCFRGYLRLRDNKSRLYKRNYTKFSAIDARFLYLISSVSLNPKSLKEKELMGGSRQARFLTHSDRHSSCRHQELIHRRRRPTPSQLHPVSRETKQMRESGGRTPMQQVPTKIHNNAKEWKPNSSKIYVKELEK